MAEGALTGWPVLGYYDRLTCRQGELVEVRASGHGLLDVSLVRLNHPPDDPDWPEPLTSPAEGMQTVEDAVIAADAGADGVVLSNHGGRQLDDAPATLSLVAPVADAVGGRTEIICDGGIRRGSDIVKAIAAGATAAMAGRAYLYGLGAAGEAAVDRVLDWFRADIIRTLTLVGAADIASLERSLIYMPEAP